MESVTTTGLSLCIWALLERISLLPDRSSGLFLPLAGARLAVALTFPDLGLSNDSSLPLFQDNTFPP